MVIGIAGSFKTSFSEMLIIKQQTNGKISVKLYPFIIPLSESR